MLLGTFIVFVLLFLLVVDIFAILFRLTGMPNDKSKFQVISLLTSTGFTTNESELILQHPVRRKLASWLMVFSYASSVTFISFIVSMISHSVVDFKSSVLLILFAWLLFKTIRGSILVSIESFLERLIEHTGLWVKLNKKDINFVTKSRGYGVCEVYLSSNSNLVGVSLLESNLKSKEIQVLRIDKGDTIINFPNPSYVFDIMDKITVYGNINSIRTTFK